MKTNQGTEEWSRRKLLVLLVGIVLTALLLVSGLVFAVASALSGGDEDSSTPVDVSSFPIGANGIRGEAFRNAIAAEPMLQANADDLKPSPASLEPTASFEIPAATLLGAAGVDSGYPHNEAGAVAQLAAIEIAVLTPLNLSNARTVFEAWSQPEADFAKWELAAAIQSFHAAAGTHDGDSEIAVSATPVGAQIKASDGPDWVLACVQFDLTISVATDARFGYGHCARMSWDGQRWVIAAGTPPAQAPSTWPGSQRSIDAGWLNWIDLSHEAGDS